MKNRENDLKWMNIAIEQAKKAAASGEVPVGAVLVKNDEIIAKSRNSPISSNNPTAHAEINALRQAAQAIGNYRLTGTTLYVTLEPCIMCAGALIHARVYRIVYGASDPKTGALRSQYKIGSDGLLNHQFQITGGVKAEECSELLKLFFSQKRKRL